MKNSTYDPDELREDDDDELELDDSRLDFCRVGASECNDRTGLRRRFYFFHDPRYVDDNHDHDLKRTFFLLG